jgi:quercetin dioxygenase-like cupin family protein
MTNESSIAPLPIAEHRRHAESAPARVSIVKRDVVPTLREVVVDGERHGLGILKDFRKDPRIAAFLPEQSRLSLAWVRLEPGEELAAHAHPTESMIIMAEGHGLVRGDLEAPMEGGDIVLVPRGALHGFVGAAPAGFWALSVQFEGAGLYEDPARGRVKFSEARGEGLARLLAANALYAERHLNNKVFTLLASGRLRNPATRARFYDCVQVWSRHFQRAILARSAFVEDPRFAGTFRQHLEEEFGHDEKLARDRREGLQPVWDPTLDAAGQWFVHKMLSLDNAEKTVLVHLVLEVGSSLVSGRARAALNDYRDSDYFEVHDEADEAHKLVGIDQLAGLDDATYARLLDLHAAGWDMLELLSNRIADLCDGY